MTTTTGIRIRYAVCVCERDRERERETETERQRERESVRVCLSTYCMTARLSFRFAIVSSAQSLSAKSVCTN